MNAASPDQCYFIEYQKIKDKWGMTDFQEVTVLKDVVDLPDCGVGVALAEMTPPHLAAEDRIELMDSDTLQPILGPPYHRREFEYPEPSAHAFLQLCFGPI